MLLNDKDTNKALENQEFWYKRGSNKAKLRQRGRKYDNHFHSEQQAKKVTNINNHYNKNKIEYKDSNSNSNPYCENENSGCNYGRDDNDNYDNDNDDIRNGTLSDPD